MTNEIQETPTPENKPSPFGVRLKTAREARKLERRDVAKELRLAEKIIIMMEKDRYPTDLPVTFIRGYLRSYAKFLEIPEYEVKKAIEPIKPKVAAQHTAPSPIQAPVTSSHFFMQFFTYLIVFTLIGLVGMWYTHSTPSTPIIAENQVKLEQNLNLASTTPQAEIKESPVVPVVSDPVPPQNKVTNIPEKNKMEQTAEAAHGENPDQNTTSSEPSTEEMAEEENDSPVNENHVNENAENTNSNISTNTE